MASVGKQKELLRSFIADRAPNSKGEYRIHCPFHEDTVPSAHVNFDKQVWHCKPCSMGGSVQSLIKKIKNSTSYDLNAKKQKKVKEVTEHLTIGMIEGWHSALLDNANKLSELKETRGLTNKTIKEFQIGYDSEHNSFTIPIIEKNKLVNVRRYNPNPKRNQVKIWNVVGMGTPRLYPYPQIDNDTLLICEGEMDALIAIQNGFNAITCTSGAAVWDVKWGKLFKDKKVYICYDNDSAGKLGARRVSFNVLKYAKDVFIVTLPLEEKGSDITDYFYNHGHSRQDFKKLLRRTPSVKKVETKVEKTIKDVSVLDSFDAKKSGDPLSMVVTVVGKHNPSYSVPKEVEFSCSMDAGADKCSACPMLSFEGNHKLQVQQDDPAILNMINITEIQLKEVMREMVGAVKCNKLTQEKVAQQNVENLFVISSVDHVEKGKKVDYVDRRILNVGHHETQPNSTVRVLGTTLPNPKNQLSEFLSWGMEPMESTIDTFKMDEELHERLKIFQVEEGQRPLEKLTEISRSLSKNVTKIYDRDDMHIAIDLVYHSALVFDFANQQIDKGWLELLLIGDTRTGKSEAALRLQEYYGMGKIISCESASFAGIVGGLTQGAATNEWTVRWGTIPINDRRLVVLDEVSGLSVEEISQLSSIRSSGVAQLTKINQQQTYARTRLIWISNPRKGNLSDFAFGMKAIEPLIGNPEDIARFDFVLSVASNEVSVDTINKFHKKTNRTQYTSELCNKLILWVWSRTQEDIVWAKGAEEEVLRFATKLGERYVDDPPLIQAANIRVKIARMAVAMAARVFSTDATGEKIVVRKSHVRDAVRFLDKIYTKTSFGYHTISMEATKDKEVALVSKREVRKYLLEHDGLSRFLRQHNSFRLTDLMEMRNMEKDEAKLVIEFLSDKRMITKKQAQIIVMPILNEILRKIKD